MLGQHAGERTLNDVDHFWLTLGHVEGIGQPALEALALHLRVPNRRLVVSRCDGRAQFGVQPFADCRLVLSLGDGCAQFDVQTANLLVGPSLLALTEYHQHEGQREHEAHDDANGHQVGPDSRRQRVPQHHAGDEDEPKGADGDDRADQAETGRASDLFRPLVLGDHVPHPFGRMGPLPQESGTTRRNTTKGVSAVCTYILSHPAREPGRRCLESGEVEGKLIRQVRFTVFVRLCGSPMTRKTRS